MGHCLHGQEASNEERDVGDRKNGDPYDAKAKTLVKVSLWKNWKTDHLLVEPADLGKEMRKRDASSVHCLPLPESGRGVSIREKFRKSRLIYKQK